jgi:hypothetical protein
MNPRFSKWVGERLVSPVGGVAHDESGWKSALRRPGLRFSLTTGEEAYWRRRGRVRTLSRQSPCAFHTASAAHFSRFVAATRTGGEPPVSATDAGEIPKIVLAAYESASRGGELVRPANLAPGHVTTTVRECEAAP